MNLVRVLFKKQQQTSSPSDVVSPVHTDATPQQQASSPSDVVSPVQTDATPQQQASSPSNVVSPVHTDATPHSPTLVVDTLPGETSPTTRSPRRKARSAPNVDGDVTAQCPRPLQTTVFKAVRMSSHRRFAQILPNLLLGTLY